MALIKTSTAVIVMITMMSTLCGVSLSAEYKLDLDSAGWTTVDDDHSEVPVHVHLGDSIVMYYDNTKHNLIEVTLQDYHLCNVASPIAKHTSGHDNITFSRAGNYYFICGFPNHCQRGEKLIVMSEQATPSSSSSGRKIAPENKSK